METAGRDCSPEKLGAVVEATSPKLAAEFRRHSPQDIATYIALVLTFIGLMLQIHDEVSPASPAQVTKIINHVESTTIVNVRPAPPPPAASQAPEASSSAPPPTDGATSDHP